MWTGSYNWLSCSETTHECAQSFPGSLQRKNVDIPPRSVLPKQPPRRSGSGRSICCRGQSLSSAVWPYGNIVGQRNSAGCSWQHRRCVILKRVVQSADTYGVLFVKVLLIEVGALQADGPQRVASRPSGITTPQHCWATGRCWPPVARIRIRFMGCRHASSTILSRVGLSLVYASLTCWTGVWSATGSLATGREFHTATLLANGKVLVVGGDADISGFLSSCELYDPATGRCRAVWFGVLLTSLLQEPGQRRVVSRLRGMITPLPCSITEKYW